MKGIHSGQAVAARSIGGLVLLALAGTAAAQPYSQDFEGLSASTTGVSLTMPPQDAFYIPPVAGSTDTFAFTYAGNTLNFAANPFGGDHFAASNLVTARAQRDMTWPVSRMSFYYDFAAQNNGTQVNNIGSFSAQPHIVPVTHRTFIILANYAVPAVPGKYNINYIGFDGAGTIDPGVGRLLWTDLDVNTWYRLVTHVDFSTNQITKVAVTNLTTGARADASPVGLYLGGGSAPAVPLPTGFRMFNNQVSNASGYDNVTFCECACNYDTLTGVGVCDIFDFLGFQNRFDAADACACNRDTSTGVDVCDIFDFLDFQNGYDAGCP